ncbi:MAG TPA: EF-hand domain-containing protein [Blastocatellia bacterium]|nr:EF-hand domain-containing protein [Blastocatellia bacterium]
MKWSLILIATIALLLASSAVVLAGQDVFVYRQDGPPGGGQRQMGGFQMPTFADLDKNKDKKLSRDELSQFGPFADRMFERADENKDGFIDEEEFNRFRAGMRGGPGGPGGGPRIGESLAKFLDANGDGKITREEFARLSQLFDALDKDHNSELTAEEVGHFFEAVRDAQSQATGGVEVNNLFAKYDKDKDGKLTAEEMGNERTFKALDLNHDGSITRDEAEKALKQIAESSKQKAQQQSPKNP